MKEEQTKNGLHKDWQYKPFTEVAKLIRGVSYDKQNATDHPAVGMLPIIRATNIQNGLVLEQFVYVPEKLVKEEQLIRDGDILLAMSSGSKDLVGKAAQANQDYKIAFGTFCGLIRPNESINKKLFGYYFQTQDYRNYVSSISKGIGINNLRRNHIEDLNIPVPPKEIQQQIVSKIEELFSELEKGIEELKTAQQQLKVYRQAVLKWAFEGKLTNEDVKDGELPEGWTWKRLNEVCQIIGGVTKGRDFKGKATIQLPYLRVANVQDGYLNLDEIKTIEVLPTDREKYRLEYGDILYTEGGDKDKLGRGTIWKNEVEDCIHQNHVFRARPFSKDYDSKYIAFYSQTKAAKSYFFKNGKQTTNLASINLTVLSNLPIPIPSSEEQLKIVQEIESRLSVCDKIEETINDSLKQAEALRQSILKKAFEGKLKTNSILYVQRG